MTRYRVTFSVPAEVVVTLDADSEDEAADQAWEAGQSHLQTLLPGSTLPSVEVLIDLDGIGADQVDETMEARG